MKILSLSSIILMVAFSLSCSDKIDKEIVNKGAYPIQGVPFSKVQINDNFWLPKIETNRTATIPASFEKCEEMGRMDNFLIAGGKMDGPVKGAMPFDDTDVYKIIEGASYSMTTIPDPKLDAYVDSIIQLIQIGQEEDGYLTTYKTIDSTYAPAQWCPAGGRWANLTCSHELYNSGHLFEAAAAHYNATGKTNFLDLATKNADLLVKVFGSEDNYQVPGHQIVETGLIKLYQITKKQEYLDLAKHFLDLRGDSIHRTIGEPYNQDHFPVVQQKEAVGHAVRAAYMYAGMTDVAALFQDSSYQQAIDNIWENVVYKKLYLTGGIGALHQGEAFGENYELPNLTAYNETCAAIANVYWNYRMFLLHGDSKYIDVLERSLYNGVISGVGLEGTTFFYPNPLECDMHYHFNSGGSLTREPWFDCSCCPSNLCRFMPSVPGYIYATNAEKLYVNLFIQSETETELNNSKVSISQTSNYPWDGNIKIQVHPQKETQFAVYLRIPGWATDQPVPGDLYRYLNHSDENPVIKINGETVEVKKENGYAVLNRTWRENDVVEYSLPMQVHQIIANENVKEDAGLVALERGPIVYCMEEVDNPEIDLLTIDGETDFSAIYEPNLLNGVEVIKTTEFSAIPYYAWNNRGANKMKVWLPRNNN
ncbi:glycoside hydrolase family 127 protein [Sunxiuqinia sp. A32]|uniref:glycoside hydrolase family 127 protein n=1 Tax=Sunxiuqinia sp. A32 TaxID=3461496 RepID=UPI0040462796